jgi:hypothetical protein
MGTWEQTDVRVRVVRMPKFAGALNPWEFLPRSNGINQTRACPIKESTHVVAGWVYECACP